jgi:hypothetical protein
MPYFVYRVQPFAQLEPLGQYATFQDASREAKALRAAQPGQPRRVRVIFADNALAAEDLLLQVREVPPGGDDD